MAFESFADFLDMGGHGLYVWLCYGLGLVTILLSLVLPVQQGKSIKQDLRRRLRREEGSA
ncbi:MAG: heme exporter protein CcmD [Oceanospirillaceae bacterium]|nr:heme exporter protein CcmD [Oceanospirillaceae bacterium]